LDLGLDPDARARVDDGDEIGFTWGMPLYQCTRYGKHAMAEMLLERGADPNGKVYASGTPLSEAYGQRDEKMIALLERFGGKANPMAGLQAEGPRTEPPAEHGIRSPGRGLRLGQRQSSSWGQRRGAAILRSCMALERVDWPDGDPRWYGARSCRWSFGITGSGRGAILNGIAGHTSHASR
jgi:hypothetical protein